MGEFYDFSIRLKEHFELMTADASSLFVVDADNEFLWHTYLDSFLPGTNEIFRERREYDCQACRHFVKVMGNVVVNTGDKIMSLWDFDAHNEKFQAVIDVLNAYVSQRPISDVWVSKNASVGVEHNIDTELMTDWHHFFLKIPSKFVNNSDRSIASTVGKFRDTHDVFKRSLDEISEESLSIVLELIDQNSLYRGEEWKNVLGEFLTHKVRYDALPSSQSQNLYVWKHAATVGEVIGRIRNHSIGTLLTNISKGVELTLAVRQYEAIVAPSNYKRPKAIYTKKMLDDARRALESLGYADSLDRRFATLDDITVNNILFVNRDAAKRVKSNSVFDEMEKSIAINPQKFSRVDEIPVQAFVENVLPTTQKLAVFLDNRINSNMVSLIAPKNKNAPTMFKWNNNFSWAYTGNITDSGIKERVKSAGGKVDGVLRFSIQWNDGSQCDENDLDAHCITPGGFHIYYGNKIDKRTLGSLDIDIVHPTCGTPAVENITWPDLYNLYNMTEGDYTFYVNCYSNRGGRSGFRAEIEFDGQLYSFDRTEPLRFKEDVRVATVQYSDQNGFFLKAEMPSAVSSREVWGLQSNQFVPVSVVMRSPNYWDNQYGVGNQHLFFMLNGCINPERPNGFYNEYLNNDLLQHKHVLEALGHRLAVADANDQLSGVGFSTTRRNSVVVKATGHTERVLRVLF